jgi:DNA-binding response OmpR family regulator
VFVTSFCDLDARAKSCLVGGEDLLGKPFLIFELAAKALTLVLRRRLQAHATRNSLQIAGAPALQTLDQRDGEANRSNNADLQLSSI